MSTTPSVRITALPDLPDEATPSQIYIPVVENGVTRKMAISALFAYRTSGTVKSLTYSSSVRVVVNESTGRATASFYLPGAIAAFPGTQPPEGWLLCAGQAVSRSIYASLFATINIIYGVGDGRSTFNLPDLRGRTPVGHNSMGASDSGRLLGARPGGVYGNTLGAVGGKETHVLTQDETPISKHTHLVKHSWDYSTDDCEHGDNCHCGYNEKQGMVGNSPNVSAPMSYTLSGSNSNNQNLSSATPHKTVPPLVFLNYIIKY